MKYVYKRDLTNRMTHKTNLVFQPAAEIVAAVFYLTDQCGTG